MTSINRSLCASKRALIVAFGSLIGTSLIFGAPARAQSTAVLDEVRTIAAATQGVPVERSFTVSVAGTYQIKLTDLGKAASPSAPLQSLKLALTSGSAIVGTPLTAEGTTQFTASANTTYVVHVIGQPGAASGGQPGSLPGSGPFGVDVTNMADGSKLFGFSDTLALPVTPTTGVLDDSFTVPTSGNYTITLTDLGFPQNLNVLQLALTGGSSLITSLAVTNGVPASQTVALAQGTTYTAVAISQANQTANAGLYNVVVRDSGNAAVYSRTISVGALIPLGTASLAVGGYNLRYTDLAFPVALAASTQNGAVIALDNQVLATQTLAAHTTTGSASFNTTVAGTYAVFGLGAAATPPGGGSFDVDVLPATPANAPPVFSVAQTVTASGATIQANSYTIDVQGAGSYNVQLSDFQIPSALTSAGIAAVQAGTSLGTLATAGTLNFSAGAGKLSLLVFSQAPAAGGVFGLSAAPAGGGTPILETTQGVGVVFTSRKVSIANTGPYVANVTDLGFPAPFSSLYVIVSQGSTVVGSVLGGGALPFTAAAAGNYFVTFSGQPAAPDNAGTYSINVTPPPAPVVSLTSNVSHLASGASANLMWSSQNATACKASGGWSGTQALSGMASTGAVTATSTYTLTCTGAGGSAAQSVTVSVDPPSSSGGGGAIGLSLLAALAGALGDALRRRIRRPANRAEEDSADAP